MAPAVSLREAVALAGRFPLLAGVNLDVDEGEIVHIQGPNGAGKSSLLRLCCGLLSLSSGEAVVLGHDLRFDRRSVRREVGLVGHASVLYDDLTVEENICFALRAGGLSAREAPGRARSAMERLGLSGRLGTLRVAKLSAGQRRRAGLAVLAARRPRLWLLDEPHAGLDEEGRSVLEDLVREERKDGATVMIVSHELERAGSISDRVLRLGGGRVIDPTPVVAPAPAVGSQLDVAGTELEEVVHVA